MTSRGAAAPAARRLCAVNRGLRALPSTAVQPSCGRAGSGAAPAAGEAQLQADALLAEHRYLFELMGFVVLPGVLSAAELAVLNVKVDVNIGGRGGADWVGNARFGENPAAFDDMMAGQKENLSGGYLDWGSEFVDLLDHPKLLPYLGFTLDAGRTNRGRYYGSAVNGGTNGIRLDRLYGIEQHAGPLREGGFHQDWEGQYSFERGVMRNSLVVAAYNLKDSGGEDGGFCCLPGSHKAHLEMPQTFQKALNGPGNGLPAGAVVPLAPAGSVILFSEALVHATSAWTSGRHHRRVLLYKYAVKHVAQGRDAVPPATVPLSSQQQLLFAAPQEGLEATFRPVVRE